jgi:putative two-component system response regulator
MVVDYKILIVDDVLENIQVAMSILKEDGYNFSYAQDGKKALELMYSDEFDLVLLDVMMPIMDGYETCRLLKKDPRLQDIPVIFLTARADMDSMTKGFDVGGVDYITKPFHANELLIRIKTHIELYSAKKILKYHNLSLRKKVAFERKRVLSELENSQKEMIYILTELIESISDETGQHIIRVAEHSKLLAHYHQSLSFEDEEIIYHASPMHDIGKMMIPESLVHKKGTLNEEEFNMMQTHTIKAHDYLQKSTRKMMKAADIIAYQHHEKYNGKGYPQGLKGEEIHVYGRIVALADVFDALIHKRVYKDAWSIEDAIAYIVERSDTQFDPYIVKIFQDNIDEFIAIAKSKG